MFDKSENLDSDYQGNFQRFYVCLYNPLDQHGITQNKKQRSCTKTEKVIISYACYNNFACKKNKNKS